MLYASKGKEIVHIQWDSKGLFTVDHLWPYSDFWAVSGWTKDVTRPVVRKSGILSAGQVADIEYAAKTTNTCRHRPSLQTRATMPTTLSPRSRQRCSGGYSAPIQSTDSSQLRSPSLSRPQSGRTILCSHQTLQTYRHPLRQAVHIYPVVHSSGVRLRQAGLIENRP